MGYILPEIYESLCYDAKIECPKIFIETGTFKGGVPHRIMQTNCEKGIEPILSEFFDMYYTIEIDSNICAIASNRYQLFEKYGAHTTHSQMHTDEMDVLWQGYDTYFNNRLRLEEGDSAERMRKILGAIDRDWETSISSVCI